MPRRTEDGPAAETPRLGARPGRPDTRGDILRAARRQFANGYDACSARQVAREAGVDPSLIVHFFGGKEGLFMAAMADILRADDGLPQALAGGEEGLGRRLAVFFVDLWESPETREQLQALILSSASHPPAAELLQEFVDRKLVARVARELRGRDAAQRAAMAGSQLIGFAFARYIVAVPPLARLSKERAVRFLARSVDAALLPMAPSAGQAADGRREWRTPPERGAQDARQSGDVQA